MSHLLKKSPDKLPFIGLVVANVVPLYILIMSSPAPPLNSSKNTTNPSLLPVVDCKLLPVIGLLAFK
jgi:hypothetical protein